MKFDVVVGNPPYQENDGGSGASAVPVYNLFIALATKISNRYVTLISPSKWFAGGKGLNQFREQMLSSDTIKYMVDFDNAKDVFENTSIAGGVNYFLMDFEYHGQTDFTNIHDGKRTESMRTLNEFDTFVRYNEAIGVIHKIGNVKKVTEYIFARNPFGFSSKDRGSTLGDINLISSGGTGRVKINDIKNGNSIINEYKVCISKVTAEHANESDKNGQYRIISNNFIAPPMSIVTDSYLVVFSNKSEKLVKNYWQYMKTKFYRSLLLQSVTSINLSKDKFRFIPDQDYSLSSDIDWNKFTSEIDQQLYEKYGLNNQEITFIEEKIKELD